MTDVGPLLAAKGRLPLLPRPHVPRPRLVTEIVTHVQARRMVTVVAGALTGKTTLLTEVAQSCGDAIVFWYSVDELDTCAQVLLAGLAGAVGVAAAAADETHALAQLIGVLASAPRPVILIVDDIHRSPEGIAVVDRILRYLPSHAHLLVSSQPRHAPPSALYCWLEDRDQVVQLSGADLRLDSSEQQRFAAVTGQRGGAWAVEYRRGGQPAVVAGLLQGVLPTLTREAQALVELLAIVPVATPTLLSHALQLPLSQTIDLLNTLWEETILLDDHGAEHYRLGEVGRQAVLALEDASLLARRRYQAAAALGSYDALLAATLFAHCGAVDEALAAARQLDWWAWQRQQSTAMLIAAQVPRTALCRCPALALVVAHRLLVEKGARAAHALIRSIAAVTPLDRIERLRLLAHCCAVRGRTWSLERCISALAELVQSPDRQLTPLVRSYGLTALGTARGLAGAYAAAQEDLRSALALVALTGSDEAPATQVELLAQRSLATVYRRRDRLEEAEQLYEAARASAARQGMPHVEVELINNVAVLLQQRGEHERSVALLQETMRSPWVAERGLRPLIRASLADALAALDDRAGAARELHAALAEVETGDLYGLRGHLHAALGLLLAEAGQMGAARAELEQAPARHPAVRLARALLLDPRETAAQAAIEEALVAAGADRPLRAQARAHAAAIAIVQGERARARVMTNALVRDASYPLTPREAALLRRYERQIGRSDPKPRQQHAEPSPVRLRFFGPPMLRIGDRVVGSSWWMRSKGRELLWYALAHGQGGFSREEACADLFPEMDGLEAARALRNTLYELRRLLRAYGVSAAVLSGQGGQGGRLHMLPDDLGAPWEADTIALQDRLAWLRDGHLDAARDLPGLLAGGYLADLYADWTRPFRHYWEREAVHALDLAAVLYEREGLVAEALACLQREIEFCPDDDALVRRVMLLYNALGDSGGVRATYTQHCYALRDEVDAEPEPNTTALYTALVERAAGSK